MNKQISNGVNKQFSNGVKFVLIISVIAVLGVVILGMVGDVLISEVVTEVDLKEEKKVYGIKSGEHAPFWDLEDIEGNIVLLSDFLGRPLVLTFFTTWNETSTDQIKIFDDYLSGDGGSVFKIVAISNQEDRSVVLNFYRRSSPGITILLDESGEMGERYRIRTLPVTYLIDKNGIVQDVFVGVLSAPELVEKVESIIN